MYGYANGYMVNSNRNILDNVFNPITDINGLSLYLNKQNATVSSWLDQSISALDFVQTTGTKQPVISANSVDFDGIDDFQEKTIANVFNGDSSGIIFLSGYRNLDGSFSYLISSSDILTTNNWISFWVNASGQVGAQMVKSGVANTILSTNTVAVGDYFYYYIKSTSTSHEINLNGTSETVIATLNNGDWFGDILNRDNLVISGLQRSSNVYNKTYLNKVIYSNDHTIDTAPILTFMSDPAN